MSLIIAEGIVGVRSREAPCAAFDPGEAGVRELYIVEFIQSEGNRSMLELLLYNKRWNTLIHLKNLICFQVHGFNN